MRQVRALYILSIASVGCGLGLTLAGLRFPALQPAAACTIATGAAGMLAALWLLRKSCLNLVANVKRNGLTPAAGEIPDTGFTFLNRACEEITDAAAGVAAEARLSAKKLEVQLKVATAERQHAEAILYSISDAVLVTDPFDELVLANESAAKAFGFDLSHSPHAPVEKVLRDPRMIAMIREMRQSHSRTGRRVVEHVVQSRGTSRTFKVTLSSVADGEVPAGVVAVMHDVTREKEVAEMKNDFVSMVSHELRTPLASIRAYVEMLIDGEAQEPRVQNEFYEVIQSEANRLGRLIDNILNISRIESGLVRVHRQPHSLAIIAKDAIDVILPQARQKQIAINEDLANPIYQTLADRDMLYQAFLNLLGNAVKYTPAGGSVLVQMKVDEQARKIIVRIIDTGVGIPPKDLPFVFDKFFRAEANNRMAAGTGLGLSLVKHIVETVHQGRVFLESTVGKGSCFGFEMDLCE
ncbi:MAG TPA: ATP-binding protein [Tepidisphaeraceae bacterium]|jgi:two-component system phosphate regulon sensor histidine kinase PhoR|nr:ATP-binding protein [Tepidisphaeraceae bacterium]